MNHCNEYKSIILNFIRFAALVLGINHIKNNNWHLARNIHQLIFENKKSKEKTVLRGAEGSFTIMFSLEQVPCF